MAEFTPMMKQYFEIKNKYNEYLLFYRLGDFYEMFFDDAKTAAQVLDIALTGRDCGMEERAPMCGVPFHSADSYITKLIKGGFKVAICEQLEDPATAKGLVKRDVVRIITPGTVTEGSLLVDGQNNYLCAIYMDGSHAGFCVADISTAEIYATQFEGEEIVFKLINEAGLYAPSEVLLNVRKETVPELATFIQERLGASFSDGLDDRFVSDLSVLREQFGVHFMENNGIPKNSPTVEALYALIDYLRDTQRIDLSYIHTINFYSDDQFLGIDLNTRRNLELCEAMRGRDKQGSLLWVLDHTKTAMGTRLLRKWIEQPLISCNAIRKRQEAVAELYDSFIIKEELQTSFTGIGDLERLMTKVIYNTANGRDLKAFERTVLTLPQIKKLLSAFSCAELTGCYNALDTLEDIGKYIGKAIVDDPPFSVREGGFIKAGFSTEVDELKALKDDGQGWMLKIEQSEREITGIKNLKIGYNKVFGYYIEVTKSNISQVPARYIRKQTLTNCERYITEELKQMEARILGAQDKLVALEYELFEKLRDYIAEQIHRVQQTAAVIAKTDVLVSLADVAKKNQYVCPEVDYKDRIEIKDGRHPVVERYLATGLFVPNDTLLDKDERLMLITGPNMAGKSTYMRQTALIILMAQIGSYVPASSAKIGIVDKLFTRVGAADDLTSGQSTFMMEMNEVAYILSHATERSFILYDEIGRGTSTFDGMSMARAIAEYTASKKLHAKTMFATHYHELTELEAVCPGVVNFNIVAKKRGDELIFLRKIVRGAADDSYGIEVAKLAGVPNEIITRAKSILQELEDNRAVSPAVKTRAKRTEDRSDGNLSLEDLAKEEVIEALKRIDVNVLSPIEALTRLHDLQNKLNA